MSDWWNNAPAQRPGPDVPATSGTGTDIANYGWDPGQGYMGHMQQMGAVPYQANPMNYINSVYGRSAIGSLAQQQMASDPRFPLYDAQKSLFGAQNENAQMGYDLKGQMLRSGLQNDLAKLDLRGQTANNDRQYGQNLFNLANREYGVAAASLKTGFNKDLQNLYSDATSRGAITTGGTRDSRQTLNEQLMEGTMGANVTRDREQARANRMMQDADVQAKALGVDRTALMQGLDFGLQQLGLDRTMSTIDLLEKSTSADASKAAAAQSIIQQLMGMAQQNPGLMQQWMASQAPSGSNQERRTARPGGRNF